MPEYSRVEQTSSVEVVDELVKLLQDLTERPRFGELPGGRPGARAGDDQGIPLVCLVREPSSSGLLKVLRGHLRGAHPGRVPHAYHGFEEASEETPTQLQAVGAVLASVARELSSRANEHYGLHRFPRFRLVYWLMNQPAAGSEHESPTSLLTRLRERDLRRRSDDELIPRAAVDAAAEAAPWWARVVLMLLPAFLFRAKLRGLVPGREYRWLLRQPYLAPHDPGTFLGFAERLASALAPSSGPEPREDTGQLAKLLVNAFLEDIRHTYRRSLWRVRSARRTTYPVVLLDGISRDNGGYALLKLINDVRNDTGAFDPLIIISGSEKVPPDAEAADERAPAWVTSASRAYETWTRKLATDSRARRPTAWFLPLRVPGVEIALGEVPPTATLTVRSAPLWSRTWVLTAVVVLLAGAVTAVGYQRFQAVLAVHELHCGLSESDQSFATLEKVGPDDCVGVSRRAIPLLQDKDSPRGKKFTEVQEKISTQNEDVLAAHRKSPRRPFATVVYVSALSESGDTLTTNTARLMGIAAHQAELLARGSDADPLVQVLLGNAGKTMQHGTRMVEKLPSLMTDDTNVVGVLGMAQSRTSTLETIVALGALGLPIVAATLSADVLPSKSPLYFQVSPNNDHEAKIAAQYVKAYKGGKTKVQIVRSSDDKDLYSVNLAEDFRAHFTKTGLGVLDDIRYNSGSDTDVPNARTVGHQLCASAPDTAVVYAGRPAEFASVLDGIVDNCKDNPPYLLAGDDMTRHAANDDLRSRRPEIAYDVLSFTDGVQGCDKPTSLYEGLKKLFPGECTGGNSVDSQAELAYDALHVYSYAMQHLGLALPTPGHLWKAISDIGRAPKGGLMPLTGQSGVIDFEGGQIPREKTISILRVEAGNPPKLVTTCEPDRPCVAPK
ncbi:MULTISPECIES: hypothetical protein [Actinosynnema]|uniref:ABC transporter substrate-binding protein n=1 Tax=Actinosynnema TaxID=40566 RepID=UPI0020A34E04|nr:hypothetical protein [Actinosynnema pretiosum]MCP2097799.1 ABC-type branched-chain amino acid transport system, substrate-binding protein [Actinosynnema pretiosum]